MDGANAQKTDYCPASDTDQELAARLFRPIQYLGSKLRVVNEIVRLAQSEVSPGARVGDLFSGTSVVSQAFATNGFLATAVDAQNYAVVMARACLGVDRLPGERFEPQSLQELPSSKNVLNVEAWGEYAERELSCLAEGDAGGLRGIYNEIPLIWREEDSAFYNLVETGSKEFAFEKLPLIAAIYSGSYFGIQQALELDVIRHQIENRTLIGELSAWQQAVAMTALFHAASRCVHSAGKHFAQPMSASRRAPTPFNDRRLLEDRKISVRQCFVEAAKRINDLVAPMPEGQRAMLGQAEHAGRRALDECELVYLDPPYTAQQYSRFYHVLETILAYNFPKLIEQGAVTRGIYPSTRYKSSFCSKAKAGAAMKDLLSSVRASGASAIVSYSRSESGSDGNSRMISYDDLMGQCKEIFGSGKIECVELSHSYRQFNSSALANSKRKDPELLILCKTV